ncbi:LLM class flavin-dependent oxidoreductase [Streptomyces anulatus]|uniref:MupA/Atu3671 family FMN-dependent luciferase-like monooxygenase n=1 Tax=Streptomyces anulatus TaxID=1892 RepID=UPI00225ADD97|nr:MupA/Atu3671 family FMN-dependent luciferase-like monooxygenase [Streptomyces anulatus]MCX4521948.1 LLM class flavin-dependent oxidoreductase [Streptomyces anulatus]MCX4604824.1 LLM class flavin-dependent oxidoreductase [Streptomyces anulatus]WTE29647.1 LLM class flavin-dependent oxidoreductase [Streptomyces anulatus]
MTEQPRGNVALDDLGEERRLLIERLRRRRTEPAPATADANTTVVPRISLFFFSADTDDNVRDKHDLVLECAERADALGLDAVWVPERHFNPFGAPYPSPGLLLAAIAARTRRIALRAGSVVLPLHDPLLVAEEWGVLDSLSRGRTGISLASGWHTDDFVLNPDGYEERKRVLEEGLADLRTLWAGGSVVRPGPGGRPVEVRTHPCPQRSPEVWLTSSGNVETWRTAGRLNLHVLTALLEQPLETVATHVRLYHEALAEAGHRPADRTVTCMLHTHLAADPDAIPGRVRGPLSRYLEEHMSLFTKFAAGKDIGVRPEDVSEADRKALIEHGLRRYMGSAGLFGSAESCLPFVDRLVDAGINELGCLVDFGLSRAEVLESVDELGRLRGLLERR